MKFKVLIGITSLLFFWGCSSKVAYENEHRGVYLLFSPTKARLAKMDKIREMFTYIINDMSPGDTLVVDSTNHEPLRIELSKEPAVAYEQKRDFRLNIDSFVNNLNPTDTCQINNAIVRAKKYLANKEIKHRSILLCSDAKALQRRTSKLEGITVSLINFIDTKLLDTKDLAQKIEEADGRFVIASSITDLDKALRYR